MDTTPWPGLELIERVEEGNRNEVWRGQLGKRVVAVRRSRRAAESLDWELDLLDFLAANDFVVADVVPTADGRRYAGGLVVQHWVEGAEPTSEADWGKVAETLRRLHSITGGYPQRPGCCIVHELRSHRRSVDADLNAIPEEVARVLLPIFESVRGAPSAVVHGDTDRSNLRILADGRVGLLDLDESRVDVTLHDLSEIGVQVLDDEGHAQAKRLSNAWEAANAWTAEPDYARRRFESLRASLR